MTSSLIENEGFPHSRVGIPAPRHLSIYTAIAMHTRQYDNFTGNFFPLESLGTKIDLLFDYFTISLVMSPLQIKYLSLVEHLGRVAPNPGSIQVFTLRPKVLYNA